MASLPVNNNLKALTNLVNKAASVPNHQNVSQTKQEDAGSDSFDQIMNRMNTQGNSAADAQTTANAKTSANAKTAANAKTTANVKTTANAQTTAGKTMSTGVAASDASKANGAKADTAGKAEKTQASGKDAAERTEQSATGDMSQKGVSEKEVSAREEEAVTEAGEKLAEEVAKELGISPEEVEEAMEVLGLSAIQLLNPENMKQLLVSLSGNGDHLSIITDGELYGHFQNLLDAAAMTLEELGAQLGLSEEEVNTLIADLSVVKDEAEGNVSAEVLTNPEEGGNTALEGAKDYALTVQKDGETVSVKVTVDDASGEESVKAEITEPSRVQGKSETGTDSRHKESEGKGENGFVMQTPIGQPDVMDINEIRQPMMERFVSTEDIMNQITEYMKINLKGDVQELELRLHPASLGTVNVQIAAKDGMITAHFTAQNETVRAAIESQIVQLKTQFEEQGIKVDAVEVSVGDYRFGQSFSEHGENAENRQEGSKKSQRRINLNELDLEELPEDMEDSDKIAAEMMAESGNTVDYTA